MRGGGAATGCSSLGMWFADSGDPWVPLGPGGSRSVWPAGGGELGSLPLGGERGRGLVVKGAWAGSEGRRAKRRKPRGGTQGWTCVGVGLLVALVPAAREVPGLITPHPALALAALCSCPRPRGRPGAPLGPRSPWGSLPPSGAGLEAVPGARAVAADPEWGRAPPGRQEGERGHLSARLSRVAGQFTWTWTVRQADAGLGSEVHA